MNKKVALIPCYEPKDNLIQLVKQLLKHSFEIVVINDGSGEDFKTIFDEVSKYSTVISYKDNKGKGDAVSFL